MITSTTQLTVRYAETDMMGVVYHGSYIPWLEVGRTQLLKELGLPYRQLEESYWRSP
jgi:acyl-CoA thioester hydrolase